MSFLDRAPCIVLPYEHIFYTEDREHSALPKQQLCSCFYQRPLFRRVVCGYSLNLYFPAYSCFFIACFLQSSVKIRAICLRVSLPSRIFRTREPATPKRNSRKCSRCSLSSFRRSSDVFFARSDIVTHYTRLTTFVLRGNFAPAFRSASRAASSGTPSTSKIILPGNTSNWYPCGSPLPFPIPTSAAFAV